MQIILSDYLIYDFEQECLKEYYDYDGMVSVLSLFVEFYQTYKGIFLTPNLSTQSSY